MAVRNWVARAQAIVEIATVQITAYDAATTYRLKYGGKSVSTIAAGSANATATALAAAWNASTDSPLTEVTASANTDTVTLTCDTAGLPFAAFVTATVTGGTGTIGAVTTTTSATGPTWWNNADNWAEGAVPVNGDDANVTLSLGAITDGLAQSAVTLNLLNVFSPGLTLNTLGRPKLNPSGYTEFRDSYLAIGATTCVVKSQAQLIKLDFGSVANTTEVRESGQNPDQGVPAVLIKGTNIANVIDTQGGVSGLAYYDGESYVGATATFAQGSTVNAGPGAVLADTISSGQVIMQGTGTNWQTAGGLAEIRGTPGFAILYAESGQTLCKFGGTIGHVIAGGNGGQLDASQDNTPRTFTDCTLDKGGTILDPQETITYTNGIEIEPGVSQVTAA